MEQPALPKLCLGEGSQSLVAITSKFAAGLAVRPVNLALKSMVNLSVAQILRRVETHAIVKMQ
jgi:hypothetical protein